MAGRENSRRFHFLREIASGGFGSVYLAKVVHADGFSRLAAVKLLHRKWSENNEIAQRMRDEARLLGWLRHRNIVDVLDLTSIDGRAAVVMEYLEAVDLKHVVGALGDKGERMTPRAALEAIAFAASALDAAYNRPPFEGEKPLRVIHRDIKPSNIMVDESGTVKVLDFGVARAEFENRESHTQDLNFGSVEYMPPERLFFEPENDLSDVYSLGATLFELVGGERLGKAKGRREKHEVFLKDRLGYLAAACPLPAPAAESLADLVREMCAYPADARPKATKVVQRCRQLAKTLSGETLNEWAERVIPPLVRELREAPREPNPLADAVLTEDSVPLMDDSSQTWASKEGAAAAEDVADPPTTTPPPEPERLPQPAPEPPSAEVEVPRGDARWDELRLAALAEMSSGPGASPLAATAAPVMAAPAPAPRFIEPAAFPGDPADFADEPTRLASEDAIRTMMAPRASPPWPPASATMVLEDAEPSPDPAPRAEDPTPLVDAPLAQMAPPPAAVHAPNRAGLTMIPLDAGFEGGPADGPLGAIDGGVDEVAATVSIAEARAELHRAKLEAKAQAPASPAQELAKAATSASPLDAAHPAGSPPPPPARANPGAARPAAAARPAPAPARPAARAGDDPFVDPPPAQSSSLLVFGLLAVGILGGALFGGAVLGAYKYAWLPRQAAMSAPAQPVTAPTPAAIEPLAPAPPAPEPTPPAAPSRAIVFASAAEGTQRLTASCDGTDTSGTGEVTVAAPRAESCVVRAVLSDRSRLVAEVPGATSGRYTCFAGGAKACTRN